VKKLSGWETSQTRAWLTSAEGLFDTGITLVLAKNYEEALIYFKKAVKKDPLYAKAYLHNGHCNEALGRSNEQIESYKQTISIKPDYAEAYWGSGMAYGNLGQYPEAIEAYKQAIRIEPDFGKAHAALVMTYLKIGDKDSALKHYEILVDLDNKKSENMD